MERQDAAISFGRSRRGESMQMLDTAPAYGESEAVLGGLLPADHAFHIVTKTGSIDELETVFARSLERLRQDHVYGLLVHRASDLTGHDERRLCVCWNGCDKPSGKAER